MVLITTVSHLYMRLEIKIISSSTYTYSEHFLFIMIFIALRIFTGRMSHDVHFGMRECFRFALMYKAFFHLKIGYYFQLSKG